MAAVKNIFPPLLLLLLFSAAAEADSSRHLSSRLDFCGESVPLNQPEVYEALDQELLLLSEATSRVWLSLRRSGRYKALVERALSKASLPGDLMYIPFTITGFDPRYNNQGRGLWRLSESTAKSLGLRVDDAVDERLDPAASTEAAIARLADLRRSYGDWASATAAFLLGDAPVRKAINEAGGENNFYQIYFPSNQGQILFTVLAGKMLFQNPAAFGYRQAPGQAWSAFPQKRQTLGQPANLRELAARFKVDYKTFRDLNPHLLEAEAPAGAVINVP